MVSGMADDGDQPAEPPPQTPLGLDYLAPGTAPRRLSTGVEFGVAVVILGWVPFACGVINLLVAGHSYSPTIAGSHRGGAVLFFSAGVVISFIGLLRLLSLKHWPAVLFAFAVVAVQLGIVGCLGVAYFGGW
jgi:hypothetical protein